MNCKKLLTLALALVLLLSTGTLAYAQSAEDVVAPSEHEETETPVEVVSSEPSEQAVEGDQAAEVSNVVLPTMEIEAEETPLASALPEVSAEPEMSETTLEPEISETTLEPEISETPALPEETPSASTDAPESEPTLDPALPEQSEEPLSPETEPSVEPSLEPTETPEPYVSPYAEVSAGTILYRNRARTDQLGELLSDAIMLVREASVYEDGGVLYKAYFDTEQSIENGDYETAYFYSSSLKYLTQEQTEDSLSAVTVHQVDGKPIFKANVLYAEVSEETPEETPEETLSPEPTQEAEMPTLYTVKYFDSEGELMTAREVEGGKRIEAPALETEGFLGWYPCDENGGNVGATAYDFTQPVESSVYLRARTGEQEALPEETAAEQKISISMAYDTQTLQLGSRITLTAALEGYDDLNYTCYWQYAAADCDGNITGEWQNAQADTLSMSYTLAEDNLLTAWRMCVLLDQ